MPCRALYPIFSITSLKGLFTNFEYITFFSCPTKRNIFCERSILIKSLWLEIIEKKGCTKSVRVIYIIYIIVLGRTDFVHPFFSIILSQSAFIEMDLLQKNVFFWWGTKKMLYIQNWWAIPLSRVCVVQRKQNSEEIKTF